MTTERVLSVSERLYWATQDKDLAAITTLIDEGADVNWANENFGSNLSLNLFLMVRFAEQRTSLQIAVRDGFTDAVKLLLDRGANVNKTNKRAFSFVLCPFIQRIQRNGRHCTRLL